MFEKQGENDNLEEKKDISKGGVIKNKEVIAEYDEVLNKENEEKGAYISKLEMLKNKLGLGDGFSASSGIKTNLIDNDDVATFVDWKSNLSVFVSYFLVFLLLLSGSLAYLTFLEKEENKKASIYDENILNAKEGIAKEELLVDEGIKFQEKIFALESLLDKHVYWSNLFSYLEKNTLEEVSFSGFSGDTSGSYGFTSKAKDSYFIATEQIKIYEEDENTKKVVFSSITLNEDEKTGETNVDFNLNLEVDPEIFYKK
ncbi:MAG: hypothetical protein PF572_06685 [Patescibacteria group bacterium]|jgi:hypothetical protein|nr:hypothetical protein [Patescibacteria group bacterium]